MSFLPYSTWLFVAALFSSCSTSGLKNDYSAPGGSSAQLLLDNAGKAKIIFTQAFSRKAVLNIVAIDGRPVRINGFEPITLPAGKHTLEVIAIAYIGAATNGFLDVDLRPNRRYQLSSSAGIEHFSFILRDITSTDDVDSAPVILSKQLSMGGSREIREVQPGRVIGESNPGSL